MTHFNRHFAMPATFDPFHRFVAAYTLQAVRDYLNPTKTTTIQDIETARQFCLSETGQEMITALGIPPQRVKAILGGQ